VVESLVGREVGQYKVIAELARGQHSVVYKAWQPSLERDVALKVLQQYDQATLRKFQDEARLTAQLIQQGVPHIRQVYEVGQTPDGFLFVALEYVADSLENTLRRAREHNRRMNPSAAARLLEPIAEALDATHSLGWVHLDIKPQNILITRNGRAQLADFGIAQRRGMQTHACTPAYASPEQAAGNRPVGPWSDIYSLGVVLYEMIAGHPPVRGDHDIVLLNQHLAVTPPSPRKVNPRLTADQERALFRALAKSPPQRFATAGDFVRAVVGDDVASPGGIKTPGKIQGSAPGGRRPRARRLVAAGLLLLLLAALLATGWFLWPHLLSGGAKPTATPPVVTSVSTSVPLVDSTLPLSPAPARRPSAIAPRPTPTRTPRPTATLALTISPTPRPSP
jgi:serine/threonine protein kinase